MTKYKPSPSIHLVDKQNLSINLKIKIYIKSTEPQQFGHLAPIMCKQRIYTETMKNMSTLI